MDLPRIVTQDDLDPATLSVIGSKVVAQDPTKAPATITVAAASAVPIATGDTVNLALNKLQAQVNAGGGGGGGGQRIAQNIGNGTDSQYTVTHNFNTNDIGVTCYELSSGLTTIPGVVRTSLNAVRIDFAAPIATNSHRVIVQNLS